MKIKIIKKSGEFIAFSGSAGEGIGVCHENIEEGIYCDIEIDFGVILKLGVNTVKNLDKAFYIKNDGEKNFISALVESIDEDDGVCLRLADDCIIMTYYEESIIYSGDFLLITLDKEELEITAVGV